MIKKNSWVIVSILVTLTLLAGACAPQPAATEPPAATEAPVTTEAPEVTEAPVATEEPATTEEPVMTEEPGAAEVDFPVIPGGELEKALAGAYSGTTVIVDGPFADADVVKFDQSVKAFEEATGIEVNYIGNKEFEGSISIRVDADNAPDIADFPQPGLLANFVRTGKIEIGRAHV